MCESCDKLTPEQRLEVLKSFEKAICGEHGEIVQMPGWLAWFDRWCIRRGWSRGRTIVFAVDDMLRVAS